MIHKAAWFTAEPVGPATSEAIKGLSVPAFAYPENVRWDILSRKVITELCE
jgi:hypothetical protein